MGLHNTIIYGPVRSRRLGASLGVNLLPTGRKVCNFECIYCECGWTDQAAKDVMPTVGEFSHQMESNLRELAQKKEHLDYITFAGNGEPTLHPEFPQIIDCTVEMRDEFMKAARIGVLSNATMLRKKPIFDALKKIDDPMMKLDAGTEQMYDLIDLPHPGLSLDTITEDIRRFDGNVVIQSMFLRGQHEGRPVDNTTEEELTAWKERLMRINPRNVMIYTIDRPTPSGNLQKISRTELEGIAAQVRQLGFSAEAHA